jgi:hypothetical protein
MAFRVTLSPPTASSAFSAPRSHGREGALGVRRFIRGGRQQLHIAEEFLGARGVEGRAVHQHEVLGGVALAAAHAFALHANHLEAHAARGRDIVGQDVARGGRQPEHDGIAARFGKQALRVGRRQPIRDSQLADQQAVGLGVHAADRMAGILVGLERDAVHGVLEVEIRLDFLVFGHFDGGRVRDRVECRRERSWGLFLIGRASILTAAGDAFCAAPH